MLLRTPLAFALLSLCACKPSEESHMKAIIGAVLIDGQGGPPVSNSVVVVAQNRIRAAGPSSLVPIPAEADKIDGSGKFLVPGLVDAYPRADASTNFTKGNPASAEQARSRVAELVRNKAGAIQMTNLNEGEPGVAEAILEAARAAEIPVFARDWNLKDVEFLVRNGVTGLIGMFDEHEPPDPELIAKLRDLRIFFAPALGSSTPLQRQIALRLFQAGVPLGLATGGGDPVRELELLVEAGVPPLDAIVAATRNGAVALRQDRDRGTIQAGKHADLLLLSANPGEDIRNLRKVALKMADGEWVR
jgi:imidazolonepropionase-like amidohydrolase